MAEDRRPADDPLLQLIRAAYADPRAAVRYVLDIGPGEWERLLMVGLGIVVAAIGFAVTGGMTTVPVDPETGARVSPFMGYAFVLVIGWLQYRVFSALMYAFGRMAKGTADHDACKTAVAWWTMVTAPVQALQGVLFHIVPQPLGIAVMAGAMLYIFWHLASCAAEAHRFRSTFATFGVILAVAMGVTIVFSSMLSGLVPR